MSTSFQDHFSSHAAGYARWRPSYPAELAGLLALLAPSRQQALDCGCGNGQLSVLLAAEFAQVLATDASAQQIAEAWPHPRVRYAVAPAERSGLPAGSVDLVTVAQAAHWFDLPAFYSEVRRVLRPQGCIALITYGPARLEGRPGELLRELHDDVLGPYWPADRRHVIDAYRDLPFPFEELQVAAPAMRASWSLEQLLGYVDTWSALRRAEAALVRAPCQRFEVALRAAWGEAQAPREIEFPLTLRVGRVGR